VHGLISHGHVCRHVLTAVGSGYLIRWEYRWDDGGGAGGGGGGAGGGGGGGGAATGDVDSSGLDQQQQQVVVEQQQVEQQQQQGGASGGGDGSACGARGELLPLSERMEVEVDGGEQQQQLQGKRKRCDE